MEIEYCHNFWSFLFRRLVIKSWNLLKPSYFPNLAQLTFTSYNIVNMPAIQLVDKACYFNCGHVNKTNVNSYVWVCDNCRIYFQTFSTSLSQTCIMNLDLLHPTCVTKLLSLLWLSCNLSKEVPPQLKLHCFKFLQPFFLL